MQTTNNAISVTQDKVHTIAQFGSLAKLKREARKRGILFRLRADGRGTLYFVDGKTLRQKTWNTVHIIA